MRLQNEELLSRYVRCLRAIGLMLGVILLVTASGHAGVITASWTAPTTNTDGSQLTGLARYRIYYSTSDSPCPSSTFFEVVSSTSVPQPNQRLSFQMMGLETASIYTVSITAVDTFGNESACSDVASAIAQDDSAIPPLPQDAFASTATMQDDSAILAPPQDASSSSLTGQGVTTPTMQNDSAVPPPPPQDNSLLGPYIPL